jgi:NAD(P)-dependent dehydrogenase (short-subunit alcohol dehydrogenase family)
MNRLANSVAIVTGAASPRGLGFTTARALALEGARVVLTDIDEAEVSARAAALRDEGLRALSTGHDVTMETDWQRVVAFTVDNYGALDILVNNAGIIGDSPIHEMSLEGWNRVLKVNLTGTFLGCKHAMIRMKQQGSGGSLINVASISGLLGYPMSGAYGASKSGVRSLSKVVAIEGAKAGIRCNSVYPGPIMTDLFQSTRAVSAERLAAVAATVPLGRIGEPLDIANAIVFLSCGESRYMTGAEIVVDGGIVAG